MLSAIIFLWPDQVPENRRRLRPTTVRLFRKAFVLKAKGNLATEAVPGDWPVQGIDKGLPEARLGLAGDDLCSLKVYESGRFSHQAAEK